MPSVPFQSGLLMVPIDVSALGDTQVITAVGQTVISVFKLFFVVVGAVEITFKNGLTAYGPALPMLANGSLTFQHDGVPWFQTTAGQPFVLSLSAAVQVSGAVYFVRS